MSGSDLVDSVINSLAILHGQQVSAVDRREAQNFLDLLRKRGCSNDSEISRLAVQLLLLPQGQKKVSTEIVNHFSLLLMRAVVTSPTWNFLSKDERAGIKQGLLSTFFDGCLLVGDSVAVRNKLIQVISDVAMIDWPSEWPELISSLLLQSGKQASMRWSLTIFARLCEATAEAELSVVGGIRPKTVELANKLGNILMLANQAVLGGIQDESTLVACIELFVSLATVFRRSDFLLCMQIDRFLISSLVSGKYSEETNFMILEALTIISQSIHGRRSVPGLLFPGVVIELTENDIKRVGNDVASLVLQSCNEASYSIYFDEYAGENIREMQRCLGEVFVEVVSSCFLNSPPDTSETSQVINAAVCLCLYHPSLLMKMFGGSVLDFLVKRHREKMYVHADLIIRCSLALAHKFDIQDKSNVDFSLYAGILKRRAKEEEGKWVMKAMELLTVECEEEGSTRDIFGRAKSLSISMVKHLELQEYWTKPSSWLGEFLCNSVALLPGSSPSYSSILSVAEGIMSVTNKREGNAIFSEIVLKHPPSSNSQLASDNSSKKSFFSFLSSVLTSTGQTIISDESLEGILNTIFALSVDLDDFKPVSNAIVSACKLIGSSSTGMEIKIKLSESLKHSLFSGVSELRPWKVESFIYAVKGMPGASDSIQSIFQEISKSLERAMIAGNAVECRRSVALFISFLSSASTDGAATSEFLTNSVLPNLWRATISRNFQVTKLEWDMVFGTGEGQKVIFSLEDAQDDRNWFNLYCTLCSLAEKCTLSSAKTIQPIVSLLLSSGLIGLRPFLLEHLVKHVLIPIAKIDPVIVVDSTLQLLIDYLTSQWKRNLEIANSYFLENSLKRLSNALLSLISISVQVEEQADSNSLVSAADMEISSPSSNQSRIQTKSTERKKKRNINRFAVLAIESHHHQQLLPTSVVALSPVATISRCRFIILHSLVKCIELTEDIHALQKSLNLVPIVVVRFWSGITQSVINRNIEAEEFCDFIGKNLLKSVLLFTRTFVKREDEDAVERIVKCLQGIFSVLLSLFQYQCKLLNLSADPESVGNQAISRCIQESFVLLMNELNNVAFNQTISSIIKNGADKNTRNFFKSIVLHLSINE